MRNKYQRKERKCNHKFEVGRAGIAGAGAVADRRGVARDASAGRRADRAIRAAYPAHPGKRSHAAGGIRTRMVKKLKRVEIA
jgi:hypothetical protein